MSTPPEPTLLAAGRFLQLVREGHWEYARRPGSIESVAVIAITDDNQIVLVQQDRIPVHCFTLELPAGLARDEADFAEESLLTAAQRELLEETGYTATHWQHAFHVASSTGLTDETAHVFLATGLTRQHAGGGVQGENITVRHCPLDQPLPWLQEQTQQGLLADARVYAALGFLAHQSAPPTPTPTP